LWLSARQPETQKDTQLASIIKETNAVCKRDLSTSGRIHTLGKRVMWIQTQMLWEEICKRTMRRKKLRVREKNQRQNKNKKKRKERKGKEKKRIIKELGLMSIRYLKQPLKYLERTHKQSDGSVLDQLC
jgi:hypothetical protein